MGAARIHDTDAVSDWGLIILVDNSHVEHLEIRKGENRPDHNQACSDHLFDNDLGGHRFAFPFKQTLSVIFGDP
jgi:hypothetical protein